MMSRISAVLIVKNERQNIVDCLEDLNWADDLVVLDTGSDDDTAALAKNCGARVFHQEKWEGFGRAKQEVVSLALYDWILSIDADERISAELKRELIRLREVDFENKAWQIKRLSYYLGKPIRYCGWQNDKPLRLFNRKFGGFNDKAVHESIKVSQEKEICKGLIYHHTYPDAASHFRKMRFYAELAKDSMNKSALPLEPEIRAALKFIKMYFLKLGFLDGLHGFLLCKNSAWGIWYKYRL
jgi:(heptosyl)LPS beta-1,4-glucosyltransferase